VIHIVQQFTNAFGGTEIHALNLYDVLRRHGDVRLWSEFDPDPRLMQGHPIELIRPKRLAFPKTGTMVFCGACWYVGPWLEYTAPRRIIVLHNYPHDSYKTWLQRARRPWMPRIEWLFASEQMKAQTDLEGIVEPSPIDLQRFRPADRPGPVPGQPFTVGRLSRDVPEKFHEDDPALYTQLAEAGVRVRIMGGLGLRDRLPAHPLIELWPAGAQPPEVFLQGLDAFIYRTRSDWFEAFGRVVLEAMACGLPVVADQRGGYAEQVRPGDNGFLTNGNEEALRDVLLLRADSDFRRRVGAAARATAQTLYGEGLPREMIDFYLR
jgi:glycosyltransferase involved in cell wall biosynthesis